MVKEDLKRQIEQNGLVCDCGVKVYEPELGMLRSNPIIVNITMT
jgi:hypothetical protein